MIPGENIAIERIRERIKERIKERISERKDIEAYVISVNGRSTVKVREGRDRVLEGSAA